MSFADYPTARAWYGAVDGSVVAACLEPGDLAKAENSAKRTSAVDVVLYQVLYAHALVSAPRIALGLAQAGRPVPRRSPAGNDGDLHTAVASH